MSGFHLRTTRLFRELGSMRKTSYLEHRFGRRVQKFTVSIAWALAAIISFSWMASADTGSAVARMHTARSSDVAPPSSAAHVPGSQFFTIPGSYNYAPYAAASVFDINEAGTVAVMLTYDPYPNTGCSLISFDPVTGEQLDLLPIGFGPLEVQIADTADGARAVVLTSEGGPNTVTILDLSPTGTLTMRAQTRLTNSIADFRSNLALSAAG